MRHQKMLTLRTGVTQRETYQTHEGVAQIQNNALEAGLKKAQERFGDDWYLLSVVPAGSSFPAGYFLTTWEYDDEDEVTTVLDSTDEVEAFSKGEDRDVAEDGDTSPHVQYGEAIRVNGVRFRLTEFSRSDRGSHVTFIEESELQDDHFEPYSFQRRPRVNYNQHPWGVEGARISYNQPRDRNYRG